MTTDQPLSVLFVCTANICRSAFAERWASHLLGADTSLVVASAGTHGYVDAPMDPPMAEELEARGADASTFRSRPLTMDMAANADLVLTAGVRHRSFILDERPALFRRALTLGQLDRVLDDLPDNARGRDLLQAAQKSLKPAEPADDVSDPYGRGPAAAALAADTLVRLVTRAVDRLRGPAGG